MKWLLGFAVVLLLAGCGSEADAPTDKSDSVSRAPSVSEREEFVTSKVVCAQEGLEGVAARTGESPDDPAALATAYSEGDGFIVPDDPRLTDDSFAGCLEGLENDQAGEP